MFNAAAGESNGEWYLGVYCRKCQAPIPVFQDPGRGTAITAGSGKLTVACPRCGKKAHYAAREVITFLVYADRPATAERAPVNDDQPIGGGVLMADEPVLDLAPYEIPDAEPEDELVPDARSETEPAPELGQGRPRGPEIVLELAPYEISEGEAAEPAPEPVAEAEPPDHTERHEETTAGELPAPGVDPAIERDVPEVVAEQSPLPEPSSTAAPSVEPAGQPDREEALELEAFFDTSPLPEPGPAEVAPGAPAGEAPATEEAPGPDMPVAALLPEAAETTPVAAAEPEPVASSDSEPVPSSQVDAALDLEAFFEASPLPEAAPVEASAPEPEPAASRDPGPPPDSRVDAGLDLEAFFEASPLPEAVPVEAPTPEPAPAPAIELEAPPETDVEPIRQPTPDAGRELEAFFEAIPPAEPAPLAETPTEVPTASEPAASEAFAREALISSAPTGEIPAGEIPPAVPAVVDMHPAEPPPPAPPKPIAVVYRERWADAAARPQIIKELRPLIQGLKARAETQRHDVLVRVTDLFMDYLVEVAPERQSGVAIEQYIHALFALSARGRLRGTDRMGEEMAATLRALNRHAGLYTRR